MKIIYVHEIGNDLECLFLSRKDLIPISSQKEAQSFQFC